MSTIDIIQNAPICCQRSGEAANCAFRDRPVNWVLLTYGLLTLLVWLLAVVSTATPQWSTFTIRKDDFHVGLWMYHRNGLRDDDTEEMRNENKNAALRDLAINWAAYETNRATTLITVLLSFFVALYYLNSACARRIKSVEIGLGVLMLILFLLSMAGSSVWIDSFSDNFYFDNYYVPVENKMICASSCLLQMFNASLMLVLGILMVFFGAADCCCCPDGGTKILPESILVAEDEIPPVSQVQDLPKSTFVHSQDVP